MKSLRPTEFGFTLVELLVVVVVLGILASVGIGGFQSLIQSQQVKKARFELFASLNLARSEAIKRNQSVTLMPNDATNWGKGWVVTSPAGTIKSHSELKKVAISGPASVVYAPTGRAALTTFSLDSSIVPTANARCIGIELSGMLRAYKPVNGIC
jgi:type IV fimbrial biogenesis protein FimT